MPGVYSLELDPSAELVLQLRDLYGNRGPYRVDVLVPGIEVVLPHEPVPDRGYVTIDLSSIDADQVEIEVSPVARIGRGALLPLRMSEALVGGSRRASCSSRSPRVTVPG